MRRILVGTLAFLATSPALTQELRQTITPPPGGIEVASDGRLIMSSDICATLAPEPSAVPGAEYQPGVDVNGRPVASADLPSSAPPILLDNFPIEIKKDLAGKFNVPASGGNFGGKAVLGYVTLRDNRAYFNGQPMGDEQRMALIETCRNAKH